MGLIELHSKHAVGICLARSAVGIECFGRKTQASLYNSLCPGWYIGLYLLGF